MYTFCCLDLCWNTSLFFHLVWLLFAFFELFVTFFFSNCFVMLLLANLPFVHHKYFRIVSFCTCFFFIVFLLLLLFRLHFINITIFSLSYGYLSKPLFNVEIITQSQNYDPIIVYTLFRVHFYLHQMLAHSSVHNTPIFFFRLFFRRFSLIDRHSTVLSQHSTKYVKLFKFIQWFVFLRMSNMLLYLFCIR